MKRIMVFFFVLGTISIIGTFLGALMYFLAWKTDILTVKQFF
jgi:hypothetical protein